MTAHVGVGGANRAVVGVWVGVGGTWRLVSRADVGVGGAWRNAFAPIALDDTYNIAHVAASPANAAAIFELNTDGGIYRTLGLVESSLGNWTVAGDDTSQYEVVVTLDSGSLSSGSTGTLGLGTTRSWSVTRSSPGAAGQAVLTLQIRRVGSAVVLDSTVVTLTAEVSA